MSTDPGTEIQRGPPAADIRYEARDAPARRIAAMLGGLILALLLLCGAVAGFLLLLHRDSPAVEAAAHSRPPEPRLQVNEADQRYELEAAARTNLRGAPGRAGIDEAVRRTAAAGWGSRE